MVHDRKEADKFVLEEISNHIMKSLESFDDKTIIVTFEILVTNAIKVNTLIYLIKGN